MIKFLDIKIALNNKLKASFPNIPVKSQDIAKGFARPSFTVLFDEPKIETLESQIETSLTVQIYYFPDLKDVDESLTTMNIQGEIPLLLGNKLAVKDRFLNLNEHNSNIVEGIIIHECSMLFYQDIPEDDSTPLIQDLQFKQ